MNEQRPTNQPACIPEKWSAELECDAISSSSVSHDPQRPQAEAIAVASVWQMESPTSADAALAGGSGEFVYRRDGHPNERSLATKLAKLHHAQRAVVTAQGMSALSAVALTLLQPGSQVWLGRELYGKTQQLFATDLARWQVRSRAFDPTDQKQVEQIAGEPCDLVLVETISNPTMKVPELAAMARVAHAAGGKLVVDNTFATHLICQPLEHGADLVVESLGKLVNGHSDAMLGLVCGNDDPLMTRINGTLTAFGLASSPLDCYLTHRGLMSLALRLDRACSNALALAGALASMPGVVRIEYPGLRQHPQHALAAKQFRGGYGWMLALELDMDRHGVQRIFDRLRPEIPFVPSLGDAVTTVSHPASTSHRGLSANERQELGISEGTIRVSCGIEPTAWLVERFTAAVLSRK